MTFLKVDSTADIIGANGGSEPGFSMRETMAQIALFCFTISMASLACIEQVFASPLSGFFADEVVFLLNKGQVDSGPSGLVGQPDGLFVDFDGGGATLKFSETSTSFDYGVATIPSATDLIVVDVGVPDFLESVSFGYGTPQDSNNDGLADSPVGFGMLLGSTSVTPSWSSIGNANLLFYDFDTAAGFMGFGNDFFVSFNDVGDFELDSAQLVGQHSAAPVPEPTSAIALLSMGVIVVGSISKQFRKHC
ncbi:MAG: hypothetical protein F6J86_34485 [Symploca sp. SIO1B1]|nr:hypothetical protein [Symploca sp. SIO1B1]